jgi:hypothetical protein
VNVGSLAVSSWHGQTPVAKQEQLSCRFCWASTAGQTQRHQGSPVWVTDHQPQAAQRLNTFSGITLNRRMAKEGQTTSTQRSHWLHSAVLDRSRWSCLIAVRASAK